MLQGGDRPEELVTHICCPEQGGSGFFETLISFYRTTGPHLGDSAVRFLCVCHVFPMPIRALVSSCYKPHAELWEIHDILGYCNPVQCSVWNRDIHSYLQP